MALQQMSTIVSLVDRRPRRSSVLCEPLGVRFPQIFRVTCDPARVKDPAARALAGNGSWVTYTLGTPLRQIVAPLRPACTAEPIDRLVPGRDCASVVVRHHPSHPLATGYEDAMTDAGISETQLDIVVLDGEIYTILTSDVPPFGQEPYTITYAASLPGSAEPRGAAEATVWEYFVPREGA